MKAVFQNGIRCIAAGCTLLGIVGAAPAGGPVSPLPQVDLAGLRKQVAARKGKVVVVNFWASWCGTCKDEFPDLVRNEKTNKAKGLDLVTVAFDETKDVKPLVIPFLTKNKKTTSAFVNKTGSMVDDAYIKAFEPKVADDAAIALPRTYVFDRQGKLVKAFSGQLSYATLQKTVAPLLAKK